MASNRKGGFILLLAVAVAVAGLLLVAVTTGAEAVAGGGRQGLQVPTEDNGAVRI
jgi:hypothetical protein